jgi:hypothetical protein
MPGWPLPTPACQDPSSLTQRPCSKLLESSPRYQTFPLLVLRVPVEGALLGGASREDLVQDHRRLDSHDALLPVRHPDRVELARLAVVADAPVAKDGPRLERQPGVVDRAAEVRRVKARVVGRRHGSRVRSRARPGGRHCRDGAAGHEDRDEQHCCCPRTLGHAPNVPARAEPTMRMLQTGTHRGSSASIRTRLRLIGAARLVPASAFHAKRKRSAWHGSGARPGQHDTRKWPPRKPSARRADPLYA